MFSIHIYSTVMCWLLTSPVNTRLPTATVIVTNRALTYDMLFVLCCDLDYIESSK